MANGELIEMLIKSAAEFQRDENWMERNEHMYGGLGENVRVSYEAKAAVLTGFLNHVAANNCCLDLGMYFSDFLSEVKKED